MQVIAATVGQASAFVALTVKKGQHSELLLCNDVGVKGLCPL